VGDTRASGVLDSGGRVVAATYPRAVVMAGWACRGEVVAAASPGKPSGW
jgi:hypothetical protein